MNKKKEKETSRSFPRNPEQLAKEARLKRLLLEDNLSIKFLSPLINNYPYIPFTGSSMRPFCLNQIINDIIINNRKKIMEFGSGISSILIGRLIKKNNLSTIITSIEHDPNWFNELSQILLAEKLNDVVKIYHCPLKECRISLDENLWYDMEELNKITSCKIYDMVIIDGPLAWKETIKRSRYPAVPYVFNLLDDNYSIYIDDANREGERSIINLWEQEFSVKFSYSSNSLAYCHQGNFLYTRPFAYY